MNSYRVIDEKFTKPSSLSRELRKFTSKVLSEMPPVANSCSTDIVINITEKHQSKRKICACNQKDYRYIEDTFCKIFKKLRLDSDDPNEQVIKRVTHSAGCNSTNHGCCSMQHNFAGANKWVAVKTDNLKFSKIPVRIPSSNSPITSVKQSKIPIPVPQSTNRSRNGERLMRRRRAVSYSPKSSLKSETGSNHYIKDIMDTFPKSKVRVSFSEFVEDVDRKVSMLERDYKKLSKQPPAKKLSLPMWKY